MWINAQRPCSVRLLLLPLLLLVLPLGSFLPSAEGVRLFAANTQGAVTTLEFDAGAGTLEQAASLAGGCGAVPNWLTVGGGGRVLYCLDDRTTGSAGVHALGVGEGGKLDHLSEVVTSPGAVSSTLYDDGSGGVRLAVAFYHSQSVSSIAVSPDGTLSDLQTLQVTSSRPGTGRQSQPHPHDAVLDPSGSFVVVPDLGSDQVRVFRVSREDGGQLVERASTEVDRGSGPRHAEFWCPSDGDGDDDDDDGDDEELLGCVMYLVSEVANRVTTFRVLYDFEQGEMGLVEVGRTTTFGGEEAPRGTFGAAEVEISPDKRFVTVSNRGDNSFANSDSLATYAILPNGTLEFVQLAPAGGLQPRHFTFSPGGDYVAVGLQRNNAVAVLERDVRTGMIGGEVARVSGQGNVACVVWEGDVMSG